MSKRFRTSVVFGVVYEIDTWGDMESRAIGIEYDGKRLTWEQVNERLERLEKLERFAEKAQALLTVIGEERSLVNIDERWLVLADALDELKDHPECDPLDCRGTVWDSDDWR
jgi:hypothetical protein